MAVKILGRRYHESPFTLQWHLTARCQQNCRHCYMKDEPTYKSELLNELSFKDCLKIIDDFAETFHGWGILTRINFTGGDPLLKPRIFDLIKYARKKNITVGILGNPNLLTKKMAKRLKLLGVSRYQVSLDGMEGTHDQLRGKKGLFKDVIKAVHILEGAGIPSVVMFTLSKVNAGELIDVIRLVAKEGVSIFDFARLVPIGRGKQLKDRILEPQEYKDLLLNVLEEYRRLEENGCRTHFGRKDHLWLLLYQELGLLKPLDEESNLIYGGCGIGSRILTILADGTVYACRRLPVKIGQVPQQSIREIFINSPEHNKMRHIEKMEKCRKCELLRYCRGCPAVAYAVYGDYYAPDPQCWKEVRKND